MNKNRFDLVSPSDYIASSAAAEQAAIQMHSRLDWVTLQPKVIIDMGCGDGAQSELLGKRYPNANVLGMDSAALFLQYARGRGKSGVHWIGADANQLPVKAYGIDLIFANLLLPWCVDWAMLFREWRRALKSNGLLMFTALGLESFCELRHHVNAEMLPHCIEMHDLGDAMLAAGFLDPVLDVEPMTLTYRTSEQLVRELKATGVLPFDFDAQELALEKNDQNLFSLTYEIIYGHAWGPGKVRDYGADETGEVRIPVSALQS